MWIIVSRVLSVLVAIGYLVATVRYQQQIAFAVLQTLIDLLLPLALIWFPEELASVTGNIGRGSYAAQESPAWLITALGWLVLILPGAWYLFAR